MVRFQKQGCRKEAAFLRTAFGHACRRVLVTDSRVVTGHINACQFVYWVQYNVIGIGSGMETRLLVD